MKGAHNSYLQTEVASASPQRLQLLLIDAAIRQGESAREHWRAGRNEAAGEAIIRCQQIVAQLLGGIRHDRQPDLAGRVAAVYTFVFNCFVAASLRHDEAQLDDALSVLAVEQETWRQVCAELASQPGQQSESASLALEG